MSGPRNSGREIADKLDLLSRRIQNPLPPPLPDMPPAQGIRHGLCGGGRSGERRMDDLQRSPAGDRQGRRRVGMRQSLAPHRPALLTASRKAVVLQLGSVALQVALLPIAPG